MKALIQIRTTEEIKIKIQKQAEELNMSVSQFILKSVEDKKDFVSIFEHFNKDFKELKDITTEGFYCLREDIQDVALDFNEKNKHNSSDFNDKNKHYSKVDIEKEEIIETDLIIISNNIFEVIEHNREGEYFLVSRLSDGENKKLSYENYRSDSIIKRRS